MLVLSRDQDLIDRDSLKGEVPMLGDFEEDDAVVTATAPCPMPGCCTLAVAYRVPEEVGSKDAVPWKFVCLHCGFDFEISEDELISRSVPRIWNLAGSHFA